MNTDVFAALKTSMSRRDLLRALTRGVLLGGLVALGVRVAARRSDAARADLSVCRHKCGDCWRRTICSQPEASWDRKARRHGTR